MPFAQLSLPRRHPLHIDRQLFSDSETTFESLIAPFHSLLILLQKRVQSEDSQSTYRSNRSARIV